MDEENKEANGQGQQQEEEEGGRQGQQEYSDMIHHKDPSNMPKPVPNCSWYTKENREARTASMVAPLESSL